MDIDNLTRDESYQRYIKYFPRNNDLTLIIIKGHLLIEVEINSLLNHLVKDIKHLEKAKLTFYQKICLLESLLLKGSIKGTIFKKIEMINTFRNNIAHNLEPKEINNKLKGLLYCLLPDWKKFIDNEEKNKLKLLRIGISMVLGQLSSIVNKNI